MTTLQLTLPVTPVVDGLPDADTDVIVFLADDRSEQGSYDGERWLDCAGNPFEFMDERVIAWANFPELQRHAEAPVHPAAGH